MRKLRQLVVVVVVAAAAAAAAAAVAAAVIRLTWLNVSVVFTCSVLRSLSHLVSSRVSQHDKVLQTTGG